MKDKKHRIPIAPFQWSPNDPLAGEHQLVANFIKEALARGWEYWMEVDLAVTESGKKILESNDESAARLALSLVAYASHWDSLAAKVKALEKSELGRINWHHTPEWKDIWYPRMVAAGALRRMMRRKLPLGSEHLVKMADWIFAEDSPNDFLFPLKSFAKAVEAHGPIGPNDGALRASLTRVAQLLRNSYIKVLPKLAQGIENLLRDSTDAAPETNGPPTPKSNLPNPSIPAPAGSPNILVQLKQTLGIAPEGGATTVEVGFDHFPLRSDSPLQEEHELINMLFPEVIEKPGYHESALAQTKAGRAMLNRDDQGRAKSLLAVAERCVNAHFVPGGGLADHRCWQSQSAVKAVLGTFLKTLPKVDRDEVFDLLLFLSSVNVYEWGIYACAAQSLVQQAEKYAAEGPLAAGERYILHRIRARSVRSCPFGNPPADVIRLTQLLGDGLFLALVPGEAWADAVNVDLGGMDARQREKWLDLLKHTSVATSARPSAKWLKTAREHLKAIGADQFATIVLRWLPLVNAPRTVRMIGGGLLGHSDLDGAIHDDNATCLRGLVWMSPDASSPDLIRALGTLTVSCYRKIPGVGPRAVKVGNAGVYALSQINDQLAVGQLALLKVKVKFGSAQKEIEKAFNAAAERSGLPREELEEMSIPTYGLTDGGVREEEMGDFKARLTVTGTTSTEIVWAKASGKVQRAVPASVRAAFKDDLKELQAAAKDIQKMLPAQRERIDSLFLQQKTWTFPIWRERYLNHPLIGTLARRILWEFKTDEKLTTGIWFDDRLVDRDLRPLDLPSDRTTVQLWHPIGKKTDDITAWRSWFDAQQIQQPFKQAHREIYVLTDAERNTSTYSNRYAAHVIKQHQFNALCGLRGWKNQLRLLVDVEYPPATLQLPQWGMRAEFWIEGLGTDYGADTNDSGTFYYLSTDQVRFYRVEAAQRTAHAGGGGYHAAYRGNDAEPLPLDQIPTLALSEVMRDVDMFVGVASVGNDPTWSDGGPQGRYQRYWQDYSFGELNASAKTRKEVLQRLVPRLKIAGCCSFNEKFLVVRGTLRTYKIHLGSGNILMEPNDQYLCIVPRQSDADEGGVLLPFEGDRTLSIILSKAFILADDAKIKDQTIVGQIKS